LVEDRCRRSQGEVDRETFGSDIERQDLRTISYSQSWPRETSYSIKEEDHCNHSASSTVISRLSIDCRTGRQNGERDQHPHGRNHEKHSPTDLINKKREEDCNQERPDLKSAIDE
jgi:hypothetical protein